MVFMGENSMTRKWQRSHMYGGLAVENSVQAIARDILADGITACEASDKYPVVFHVHDEIVAEVPEGTGDLKEFELLISNSSPWAAGCPVEAKGFRSRRYRK